MKTSPPIQLKKELLHGKHACFNSIPRSREGKIVRTELRDKMIQETNELIQNPGRKVVFFREKLFTTKQ